MTDLSIIVLSYNTKEITLECISQVASTLTKSAVVAQIIVLDNCSVDGSQEVLSKLSFPNIEYYYIQNLQNTGFSRGNNEALKKAKGEYILYLNSDLMTKVVGNEINWKELISRFENDAKLGALTVRVNLQSGEIDKASHRGFPTPIRSLWYFLGIEKVVEIFAKMDMLKGANQFFKSVFGGYHLLDEDLGVEHEIDSATGAFLLCRGSLVRELRGFDEDFFMYGEDLDLCYRMKKSGYKVIWFPKYNVTHLKYVSGLSSSKNMIRRKINKEFYKAMWIFYRKHYMSQYGVPVSILVKTGINIMSFIKTGSFV